MTDTECMKRAIELAKLGKGHTNPNPLVGAVIVKDGVVVAEGYHHAYGELHAERNALKDARERGVDVRGATMFVTLEPCCHHGKQPPCTDALIESGVAKVVVGSRDPNFLVDGKGVQQLTQAGIEVVQDFLKDECDALNPIFFHYIKTRMPYVIIKYAMTMDGETATSADESQWITGELARENVHRTRSDVMAVMTGIGTVLKDDPMLNVRLPQEPGKLPYRQPLRVVVDSWLRIPLDSKLVKTARDIPVVVFASQSLDGEGVEKLPALKEAGVTVELLSPGGDGEVLSIRDVLTRLGEHGVDSVLVESGGVVNASFFFRGDGSPETGLVQEVHVYIAPKIFGNDGNTVHTPVRGRGVMLPDDARMFGTPRIELFGDDILLKYEPHCKNRT